ncbi:MAG: hypothetical protein HYX47_12550 [Burkholderiales bacterium]|nr:hypothetical protein [Burkholderiales bacterium]
MFRIPHNVPLAILIFWIWVGFVAVVLATYFLIRWWRRKHPLPPPAPELSYSARLRERLEAQQRAARAERAARRQKAGSK